MCATVSPLTLAGLVMGLFCRTIVGPVPSAMPSITAPNQASPAAPRAAAAPARSAVRDFAQSSPSPEVSLVPTVFTRPDVKAIQPTPVAPPTPDVAESSQEAALVAMIDSARADEGEAPLAVDPLLMQVARAHSKDMCARNYFDHYAPLPGPATPMDRYLAALGERPDYAMVGENIFYRSATDSPTAYASESNDAFMHSPGHRANILNPDYTKVGIGIYANPDTGEFWVTEMFLRDRQ